MACPSPSLHSDRIAIPTDTYARLLSLADQAPLECLPLAARTLSRARTLGYNQIGQVRTAPCTRLSADFGADRAQELQQALDDFGLRPRDAAG